MGQLCSKHNTVVTVDELPNPHPPTVPLDSPSCPARSEVNSLNSPFPSPLPDGVAPSPSPARTPWRKFRWPLPPPSPAKPIMSAIMKRRGPSKMKEGPIAEEDEESRLDKTFEYPKNFESKFEVGEEVGRGHFGHTCRAKGKKGDLKGQTVAVKIISKAKMTTAISIEDVRREVKLLKVLSGQKHLIRFHGAFEDEHNVYVVMELCEGGELLDRIIAKGGNYTEDETKAIIVQILSAVAYFHLQGVVHRDLKPENFLFTTKEDDAVMKIIDFGLSDFIGPGRRLTDVVGSAYYVAPEVLHRSYGLEADLWSVGVIAYILLCGSRPFWARTESGIFRSVLRADPNFDDKPWPMVSPEAKDFVKRLLNKDHRKRMTAAQALSHPWLRDTNCDVPLDILIYKLVKSYVRASPFRRAALKALSKVLPEDELQYLRAQFLILEPNSGYVTLDNFRGALTRNATDAMKESRVTEILQSMEPLGYKKLDFEEFCAATISVYQLEARRDWEETATKAFEHFECEGNRVTSVEELAQGMNLDPRAYSVLKSCIRDSDRKLSLIGYTKFLHGITVRSSNFRHQMQ